MNQGAKTDMKAAMKVGVLGGGQLARMLALAGHPLGLEFTMLDPAADACGGAVGEHLHGAYDDQVLLEKLAKQADVVTFEFENVPAASVALLATDAPAYPPANALAVAQDRLQEKTLFQKLGIPTPAFAAVDSLEALRTAVAQVGLPAVLKTRREGYDGKGQVVIKQAEQVDDAWAQLQGAPAILEGFVSFQRELSIIAVRSSKGETAFYPVSENTHGGGILHLSVCRHDDPMQQRAEKLAELLLESLDYVGVLALELFQAGDELLANEMAPRVHNSGHWTIEGAETSQFENHLRAILGLPLGSTAPVDYCAMVNFIGSLPNAAAVLAIPGAHLHAYGKTNRPGRKVGHATLRAPDQAALDKHLPALQTLAKNALR